MSEIKEKPSQALSAEELKEIYDTKMNMAIVFTGRISKLSKIFECLDNNDCFVIYRKVSKDRLVINVEKLVEGRKNGK